MYCPVAINRVTRCPGSGSMEARTWKRSHKSEAEKIRARYSGAGSTSGIMEDDVVVGCGGSVTDIYALPVGCFV